MRANVRILVRAGQNLVNPISKVGLLSPATETARANFPHFKPSLRLTVRGNWQKSLIFDNLHREQSLRGAMARALNCAAAENCTSGCVKF